MVDFDKYREQSLLDMDRTGGAAQGGITVRDYFAAKAMQAFINRDEIWIHDQEENDGFEEDVFALSVVSYDIADAMMRQRNAPPEEPCSVEEAFGL